MSTELENQILDLREKIREIKVFIDSRDWKQYTALIEAQCEGRINKLILTPLGSIDETLAQEYAKGEVAGLRLGVTLMEQTVEDLTTEMDQLSAGGAQNE